MGCNLRKQIAADRNFTSEQAGDVSIRDHFRLLQATDNLSLMTCVDFSQPSNLLHPLPLRSGGYARVEVRSIGTRHFALNPYPFALPAVSFRFPARHIVGKEFHSAEELQRQYNIAPPEMLSVAVSAS